MTIETFIGAFFVQYFNGEDIDGDDIQKLAIEHGLAVERPATEVDCHSEQAQKYDIEPGDPWIDYSDELQALMKAQQP